MSNSIERLVRALDDFRVLYENVSVGDFRFSPRIFIDGSPRLSNKTEGAMARFDSGSANKI